MRNNLRTIIFAAIMGLAASYVIWGQKSASTTTPPRSPKTTNPPQAFKGKEVSGLTIEPSVYDIGKIWPHDKKPAVFKVHNPTQNTIKVTNVASGCGCLSAQLDDPLLPPGATRELTTIYEAKFDRTQDRVLIRMTTDEPGTPHIIAYLHAAIYHEVIIEPSVLNFGTIHPGDSRTMKFRVRHAEAKPFKIKAFNFTTKAFDFSWKPVGGSTNPSEYEVTAVCTTMKTASMNIRERIHLLTDLEHKTARVVPIDVAVRIQPAIQLNPPAILAKATGEGGVNPPMTVTVYRFDSAKPIVITGVRDTDNRVLSFDVQPTGTTSRLAISFKDKVSPDQTTTGTLLITVEGEKEEFSLPYRISPLDSTTNPTPPDQKGSGKTETGF